MTPFALQIVTPDGLKFDGQVEQLVVRTTSGDLGILAGHISCVAPLGMGRATVTIDGKQRHAACIGGMVSVMEGKVTLVPTTFEWAEEINAQRAQQAYDEAQNVLRDKAASETALRLAEARAKRALVRRSVASGK
jgi:F-type H+-transporting ATPase subunit epsilon